MAVVKSLLGALVSLVMTSLANLASGTACACASIDNSSNQYLDAQLALLINMGSGSPSGQKVLNIYVYGSVDGSNFDDPATGSDAAITLPSPANMVLLAQINVTTGSKTYSKQLSSVAKAFGGVLPLKWGIVIENQTGIAAAASGHTLQYRGLWAQTQ